MIIKETIDRKIALKIIDAKNKAIEILKKYNIETNGVEIILDENLQKIADAIIGGNIPKVRINPNRITEFNSYDLIFIILHELFHELLLTEIDEIDIDDFDHEIYNKATDLEINQIISKIIGISKLSNKLIMNVIWPNYYGLPFEKRWFFYYKELKKKGY